MKSVSRWFALMLLMNSAFEEEAAYVVVKKCWFRDVWVAQLVGNLPSAEDMILESWDQSPKSGSLLGSEPASPSACLLPYLCSIFLSEKSIKS